MRLRLLSLAPSLLVAALAVSACADEAPEDPARTAVVPEADVERFRAQAFLQTLDLDADLARLEADVAATDSAAQAGYAPLLDRLRDERRRLQVRIDSLRPLPRATFDSTAANLAAEVRRLRQSVRRGRVEGAPTFPALQAIAGRDLAALDERLAAFGAAARADTTGAFQRGIDSLAADRARLQGRIAAYPDTTEAQFPPFRASVTDALLRLERRADALAADTVRAARSGATPRRPPTRP